MTPLGIQIHAHIHVTPLLKILATGITVSGKGRQGSGRRQGGEGGIYSTIKQPMDAEIASEAILRQKWQQ